MKREGRPHGMVRTHAIVHMPGDNKFNNKSAGSFIKVSSKPTNHSKFTGKCGKPRCPECHTHPCCKSKDKSKGARKVKSRDVMSDCNARTWRVVDGDGRHGHGHGSNFSGFSASEMLDQLAGDESAYDLWDWDWGNAIDIQIDDEDDGQSKYEGDYDNGTDEIMSCCGVGFEVEQVEGDEDWCLVAEM